MRSANILEAIGHTPLVELSRMSPKPGIQLFAKLEGQNPTGSLKDRIVKYMLERAVARGELTKDRTILEATSGNTGISLAMIGRYMGFQVKVVMPENVSEERKQLLHLYGAEIVFTEAAKATDGAIEVACQMAKDEQYYMPYQYGNEANPLAHYETTGVEILEDLPEVDMFIAGLGTGGSLMGVGKRLKEHRKDIKVMAVAPHPGDFIQGLRSFEEGFVPPILDLSRLDGRVVVDSQDAIRTTRELTEKEGIFAGVSSGAVLYCALRMAQRLERGHIVVLLADGGWKYLSTGLWTKDLTQVTQAMEDKLWW